MPSFPFQFTGSNPAQLSISVMSWYTLCKGICGQSVVAPVIFFWGKLEPLSSRRGNDEKPYTMENPHWYQYVSSECSVVFLWKRIISAVLCLKIHAAIKWVWLKERNWLLLLHLVVRSDKKKISVFTFKMSTSAVGTSVWITMQEGSNNSQCRSQRTWFLSLSLNYLTFLAIWL